MISFRLYKKTSELPSSWNELPVHDVFLKTPFLKALETSSPSNISTYYLGVFSDEILVGQAIIQRVEMYFEDVFRKTSNKLFKTYGKMLITKIVKGNALIVGNLMHTGQHGMFFNSKSISQDQFLNMVWSGINALRKQIREQFGKKIRIIGFKDYFENDDVHTSQGFFKAHGLYKAKAQPNMLFKIQSEWSSAENYISSFNKKYRRRYRTARKKGQDIVCRELNLDEVKRVSEELYKLYENVSDNAGVNSFKLHKQHFYMLKTELKDDFKLFGYFLEDKLIGFYTLIRNYDKLETYFLGYNKALQQQHQMYLNMLFDMAFYGITHKYDHVVFARTAMEIKSSIGAKPHNMYIYVKHTNNFIANTTLKLIVKYANPVREWEERHPFS